MSSSKEREEEDQLIAPYAGWVRRIDAIHMYPDRFGYFQPVLSFDGIYQAGPFCHRIALPSIAHLVKAGYQVGDLIVIQMIAGVPHAGKILRKPKGAVKPLHAFFYDNRCPFCQHEVRWTFGQPWCTNANCSRTTYARALHAPRPQSLDLPFDKDLVEYLFVGDESMTSLTSMFFTDPDIYQHLHLDKDEVAVIAESVQHRLGQLYGCYGRDQQKEMQKRFLDALSIKGLHTVNHRKLIQALQANKWNWGELPQVLIDHKALIGFGIEQLDARRIVEHATDRVEEIDSVARDF